MISTIKYIPLFVASITMMCSVVFKLLVTDFQPTDLIRDIVIFFILYYIINMLTGNIEKIFKNYWKML